MEIPSLDSKVQKMQLMHRNSPREKNALLVETLDGKFLIEDGANGLSDDPSLPIARKNRISKPDSLTFECYTPIGVITGEQNLVIQDRDLSSFHCQLVQPEQQPSTAQMDSDSESEEDLSRHKRFTEERRVELSLKVTKLTVYNRALNAPVLPKSDRFCGFCRLCVKLFDLSFQSGLVFNKLDQKLKEIVGYCLKCLQNDVRLMYCAIDLTNKLIESSVGYLQKSGIYHQGCVAEVVTDAGDIQLYMIEKIPDTQEDGKFKKIHREGNTSSRVTLIEESDVEHWKPVEIVEITAPDLTLCDLFHSFSTEYNFLKDNCWNAVESMKAVANSSLDRWSWQKRYSATGIIGITAIGSVVVVYKLNQKIQEPKTKNQESRTKNQES